MRAKVTKRAVDALKPKKADSFMWDTEVPGFGMRITPKNIRSYVFQYRRGGLVSRMTIGRHGAPWTPEKARIEAVRLRVDLADGVDPAQERIEERQAPTFRDFAKRYLEEHAVPKKKPRSAKLDERMLELHVKPVFGRMLLGDVTRGEVTRLHLSLRATPFQANRVLSLLSKMFNLAERWGLRPDGSNPCRHVERFRESKRERFLSEVELAKLGNVLSQAEREKEEPLSAIAAVRMLLLSGMRLGEVLSLRWQDVDAKRGVLNLPDSKTGAKVVRLGAPARKLLAELPQEEGNPYCFPGRKKASPLVGLTHVWYRLRAKAKLTDVRVHDLRHSFASVAASGGNSLIIIGALLGHREAATTARYAHLSDDPVRKAADSTSRAVAAALKRRPRKLEKVVKMESRRSDLRASTVRQVRRCETLRALLDLSDPGGGVAPSAGSRKGNN